MNNLFMLYNIYNKLYILYNIKQMTPNYINSTKLPKSVSSAAAPPQNAILFSFLVIYTVCCQIPENQGFPAARPAAGKAFIFLESRGSGRIATAVAILTLPGHHPRLSSQPTRCQGHRVGWLVSCGWRR